MARVIKPLKLFEVPEYPNLSLREAQWLDDRFKQEPVSLTIPLVEDRPRIIYVEKPRENNTIFALAILGLFGLFGLFAVLALRK